MRRAVPRFIAAALRGLPLPLDGDGAQVFAPVYVGDVAAAFQARGHDALTVRDQGMRGDPDSRIASACLSEGRGLVTLDLDFADVRRYPPET